MKKMLEAKIIEMLGRNGANTEKFIAEVDRILMDAAKTRVPIAKGIKMVGRDRIRVQTIQIDTVYSGYAHEKFAWNNDINNDENSLIKALDIVNVIISKEANRDIDNAITRKCGQPGTIARLNRRMNKILQSQLSGKDFDADGYLHPETGHFCNPIMPEYVADICHRLRIKDICKPTEEAISDAAYAVETGIEEVLLHALPDLGYEAMNAVRQFYGANAMFSEAVDPSRGFCRRYPLYIVTTKNGHEWLFEGGVLVKTIR